MRVPPRSIRAKLFALVFLLVAATLGSSVAFVVLHDVRTFRRDMVEHTALIARVIGEYTVSDLVFYDRAAATETLAKLAGLPTIDEARLYDAQHRPFAVYGTDLSDTEEPTRLSGGVWFTRGALHVTQPVSYKGQTYGLLYIRASTAQLDAKIRRHLLVMVAMLGVLLLLAVPFVYRLQGVVTRPILELAATMRRVSDTGDYSARVEAARDDEIGILCTGFNQMLEQIQVREHERDMAVLQTREKSHFLAAMSHELRTPLNSIIGFSEVLLTRESSQLEPRQRKFLTNIYRSGQHLLGIINDILDLSKVEAGRMEFCPERVALREIVDGVVAIMKGASDKQAVEIVVEMPEELPVITADPVKLKQVFFNLLSNAVKFSPERSVVRVTAQELPAAASPLGVDAVSIAFIDHGIGIPPADREAIFQPFRQGESGTARRFGGTGLGLALVRTFVERHGGEVLLTSTVGVGSTFTVVLPRRFPAEGAEENGSSTSARVLLVIQDAARRERLIRELTATGHRVVAVGSSSAASLAPEETPSGVVLDAAAWANMGSLEPTALAPPVVLTYAESSDGDRLVLGFDRLFLKPDGLDQLAAALPDLLGGQGSRDAAVLLADDDPELVTRLRPRLEALGATVDHCLGVEEGMRIVRARPHSLVVMDPLMDGMEGFRLALLLQAADEPDGVPLVALTAPGLALDGRRRLSQKLSALAHGGSPMRPLTEVLLELLARRRATSSPRG